MKATVEHIIEELDKNMALRVVGQGASEAGLGEEPFPSEGGKCVHSQSSWEWGTLLSFY